MVPCSFFNRPVLYSSSAPHSQILPHSSLPRQTPLPFFPFTPLRHLVNTVPSTAPHPLPPVPLYFPGFWDHSRFYILTSKYLKVGSKSKREHVVFVFLGLGYPPQQNTLQFYHFLYGGEQYTFVFTHNIIIAHSSAEGYLGFRFPAIRAAMAMAEQVSVEQDGKSFGFISQNGTAGPYGSSIFSFLRILHTSYFQRGCTCFQAA